MRTMNRRTFLHLFTATAAAAVAGLRPRPEPTEVVTRLGRGSRDTLDNFGIPAEDFKLAVHKWRETNVGVDDPAGIISPTILERYYQLVESGLDREQAYMQAVLEEGERIMEST